MAEERQVRNPRGDNINYLQAKNQLTTFAEMTGGYAWFPRFQGEMNGISVSYTHLDVYKRQDPGHKLARCACAGAPSP